MQPPQKSPLLTPAQADDLMHWVIRETRLMLAKAIAEDFQKTQAASLTDEQSRFAVLPQKSPEFEQSTLAGYCSHAQVFIVAAFETLGLSPRCFTLEDIRNQNPMFTPVENMGIHNMIMFGNFKHVALTVDIETTEGTKTFLLDPTFKQFCDADHKPGAILANMQDGEHIARTLLKKGFIELTPAVASAYLASFCNGIPPVANGAAAMAFMSNTEDGQYKSGLWPNRDYMAGKGWVAKSQAPK